MAASAVAVTVIEPIDPIGVTWEEATLRARLILPPGAAAEVVAYCGERDGGRNPRDWRYSIRIGRQPEGIVEVPLEGLRSAGEELFFSFRATDSEGEYWADTAGRFRLAKPLAMEDNTGWLATEGRALVPERGFISARPANTWEEALISGNGTMGAMVWGHPRDEKIILTHERLFLPWETPRQPPDTATSLSQIRDWMLAGDFQRAADFVVQQSRREGYRGKPWTDPLIPACDLNISMEPDGAVRHYLRSVNFATGEAVVRWEDSRGAFERRLFVSRADNLVVLRIIGPAPGAVDCTLALATHPIDKVNTYWGEQDKYALGIASARSGAVEGMLTYRATFSRGPGGYQAISRVVARGGEMRLAGRGIRVRGADEVLVLTRVEPAATASAINPEALRRAVESAGGLHDYDGLLQRHVAIHGSIFRRMRLDLGGGEDKFLTSEALIAHSSVERPSMALLEKIFDAGRYTILSASGELPPTLQGLWTGTWGPPWSSDYTLNGNIQSAIAANLSGNMPEAMLSLFDYVDSLVPASRVNAERLFGARGILIASRTSTHGFNNHFDATWPMTFWVAGAGWLAQYYYDYFLYTGDEVFLRRRALPFMIEAARFYEDYLIEGEDGRFIFVPSYSPENNPSNHRSQACINATMDIAVVRDLLRHLIRLCEERGLERESVPRWQAMLAKLPDYRINADGALAEWAWPGLEDNYSHRHCSHLYPLFYGIAPEIAESPHLLDACQRAVERRMAERIRQGGGAMAFGLVQLGWAATSLGDAATTDRIIRLLQNRYYFNNLASAHDPGPSLFNVDISGGLPDVIIRALVQSEPGRVRLLPACPGGWTSGMIEGVPCRGQIEVKTLKWSGNEIEATLLSAREQNIELRCPQPIAVIETTPPGALITLRPGTGIILPQGMISSSSISPDQRLLRLPAGQPVRLRMVLDVSE